MKYLTALTILLVTVLATTLWAQQEYQRNETVGNDTLDFWCRTPVNYDSNHPPAILVWWHGYGADSHELRDGTNFDALADQRGWMTASFRGPFDGKHYQGTGGQHQAQMLLDWVMSIAPFCRDSIYMAGSSMGAAAGMVWHNNHCGIHDYMAAAVVAGSPIIDCELRQTQYTDSGHTLDAMRAVFGGWPTNPNGYPWDNDSIAYEYHRASAVRLANDRSEIMDYSDTLNSMHFNALHLPVYNTWGTSDNCWSCEWYAYGRPCQELDTLRRLGGADTTVTFCSGIASHGYPVLYQDSVMMWFAGFKANRFPADISINADEDAEYYWTKVKLDTQRYRMGRYGVTRNYANRRLDINFVRNVKEVEVECMFPEWTIWDTLSGVWINYDSVAVGHVNVLLTTVPRVTEVKFNGAHTNFTYSADTLTVPYVGAGLYSVRFQPEGIGNRTAAHPDRLKLNAAYPNPFNSQITLEIESSLAARQEIRLYDVTGRVAKTITASLSPGVQRVAVSGEGMASGIYFVVLPKSGLAPQKIVLLK